MKKFLTLLMALSAVMYFASCDKQDPTGDLEGGKDNPYKPQPTVVDPDHDAKVYLRDEYMEYYYYWNEEIKSKKSKLVLSDYSIYDFFNACLYVKDRWSWMEDGPSYIESESGVYTGTWGVSVSQLGSDFDDYNIRVAYVYPGSPFEQFGVTRGAAMTHIGDDNVLYDISDGKGVGKRFGSEKLEHFQTYYGGTTARFTFRLADGTDTTFTATRAQSLATSPVLSVQVFGPGDFPGLTEKVGYFHYLSFKANFLEEIDKAMNQLREAGVKKVICDFRYNGGGDSRASNLLMSYLAPAAAAGKAYVHRKHNSYLKRYDESTEVDANENRLTVDEWYFITDRSTASASEMVINGLKGLSETGGKIYMVGEQTYGKPNGMYVLMYPGDDLSYKAYDAGDYSALKYVFLPICFYNANYNWEYIPDEGFVPDNWQPDDLFHDFTVEEGRIKACLTHIVTGSYSEPPFKKVESTKASGAGDGALLPRPEDDPHYGTYKVLRRF